MKNTLAIIGTQWGDEGKGKISDYFAQEYDVIVRWAGGDNAGHTIFFENTKYKLNIIPSGIFNSKAINIIANGCVVNLEKLLSEIDGLKKQGFSCSNLKISDRAHIIMPYHLEIDGYQEKKRKKQIGTTKRGIGPCYEDKVARIGLRICDLQNRETLQNRLENIFLVKKPIFSQLSDNFKKLSIDDLVNQCVDWYEAIKEYITDTSVLLEDLIKQKKKVLFEGAQGVMLDVDHGTYPFVTSSNPSAASISVGAGIAPRYLNNVLGVSKAYNTRVGEGVFISEIHDELAVTIREVGKEYGTVSMRPRRIGWLDIVVLKHSIRVSGITSLGITLLDVLSNIDTLKICIGYKYQEKNITHILANVEEYMKCEPIYLELKGWNEDITNVKSYDELPLNAQKYLQTISELTSLPITLFSVGPDRKQTILINDTL